MLEVFMHRKIISYTLFKQKVDYSHREWDDYKDDPDRYWYNIPSLVLANKILYPDFTTRIYVSEDITNHKFYGLLERFQEKYNFELAVIHEEYDSHDAALWRMMPLWNNNVETLLSRDIDSIPNEQEYVHFKFFEQSCYDVHTIRSHENHWQYPCRMLIGLSSFKPQNIPEDIKKTSFKEFCRFFQPTGKKWDNDQMSVIKAFTDYDAIFTMFNFLDSRINNQFRGPEFSCGEITEAECCHIEITEEASDFFEMVEDYGVSEWAGQPSDSRGQFLKGLIKLTKDEEMITILKDENCDSFYLE